MNRTLVFGIALFFAIVGLSLIGSENSASAGLFRHRGCGGSDCGGSDCGGAPSCDGDYDCGGYHGRKHRCHGLFGGHRCHGRKHCHGLFRKHRCYGCSGAAPACCGEVVEPSCSGSAAPAASDAPDAPETSEAPEAPTTSDAPEAPEAPKAPEAPAPSA